MPPIRPDPVLVNMASAAELRELQRAARVIIAVAREKKLVVEKHGEIQIEFTDETAIKIKIIRADNIVMSESMIEKLNRKGNE